MSPFRPKIDHTGARLCANELNDVSLWQFGWRGKGSILGGRRVWVEVDPLGSDSGGLSRGHNVGAWDHRGHGWGHERGHTAKTSVLTTF